MVTAIDAQKTPMQQGLIESMRGVVDEFHSLMGESIPASVVSVEKNATVVKVKLELRSGFTLPEITCAVNGPEYVRMPIQVGDKGMVIPSDFALGAMNGMGGGVATLGRQTNLATMVWTPIGNKKFEDLDEKTEKDKVVIYGPDGVVVKTAKGDKGHIDVNEDGVLISTGEGKEGYIDVSKDGVIVSTKGPKKGNYLSITEKGFEFFVNEQLSFIIDGGGARYVGNAIPGAGGATYGINTTDTGTHIDNVNFLPHKHKDVQPGTGDTGVINILTSPTLAANEDEPP